ncbi:MAG: potassium channel protein [Deltaproteobacteria bacterium]|jgi:voltage-gated potassium channel|nr:potassium channel protein [Deltaproteobacteria bacterium]
MKKILVGVFILLIILIYGTLGYMLIEGSNLIDSFYMTVISITTVGFSEVIPLSSPGKIFTVFLIFGGVGFFLYMVSLITEAMVEGGLNAFLGRRYMEKRMADLKDHYIVCGFGRIGKVICKILHESKRNFLIIENNPDEIKTIEELGYLVMDGDATNDDLLNKAHIMEAKALIAVTSSDADNVYVILSARGLRPDIYILARSSGKKGAETKLLRAGANKVFSPYEIGARRMAQSLMRPTVIDFIDLTVHEGELGLRLEELQVSDKATFANKSLMDSGIRSEHDLIVVAIKRQKGEMLFNPSPGTEILPGDILVVLGEHTNIQSLEKKI